MASGRDKEASKNNLNLGSNCRPMMRMPRVELPIRGDLLYIALWNISGGQLHYLGQVAQEHTHTYRDTIYIFLCAAWDLDLVVLLVRGLSVVNATIELLRIDPSMAEYRCYTICGGYRLSAKAKANAKSQSKSLQTQLQMLRPRRNSPDYSVNLVAATASAAATV